MMGWAADIAPCGSGAVLPALFRGVRRAGKNGTLWGHLKSKRNHLKSKRNHYDLVSSHASHAHNFCHRFVFSFKTKDVSSGAMEKTFRKIVAPVVLSSFALCTYACSTTDEDLVEDMGDGGAGGVAGDGDGDGDGGGAGGAGGAGD
jgi:hypothetical protein